MPKNVVEVTKMLADFIVKTKKSSIPSDIFEHAKVAFKDWLGVTYAAKDDPLVTKLIEYTDFLGGNKQATVIGYDIKKTICQASLINGAASHVLDYDDTMEHFLGHPSVTIFPSLLALAELEEKSGKDFLFAYLIGLKVGAVIGACGGLDHYMSGCHPTSTIGHFASAAACASLIGLDEKQSANALGIAGTQASGLKVSFGTMSKAFHAGNASRAGLSAVLLAQKGFTGSEYVIEGDSGFFKVFQGKVNEAVLKTLGETWEIENLAQKYHASCHATHSPIEAARSIVSKEGIKIENIKHLKVFSSALALSAANKMNPDGGLEGKFSIPYCVANALINKNTGTAAFSDDAMKNKSVQELMGKITVQKTTEFNTLEANVEIETNAGESYTEFSDILKTIPGLEEKKIKISAKFLDLCTPVLGENKTAEFENSIDSLETIKNMKTFIG